MQFIRSTAIAKLMAEAKSMGVTNLKTDLFDVTPFSPEPLRP